MFMFMWRRLRWRDQKKVSVRYAEHNKPSNKSKSAAHLEQNNDHYFTWRILHVRISRRFL